MFDMEEIFRDPNIYRKFGLDFAFSKENQNCIINPFLSWRLYIKKKDMGILCINDMFDYKIVDEKKWMLAKIKYGF